MAARHNSGRHDSGSAPRGDERRRRGAPRHSIAETDPLRWVRDDDETTADLPAVSRGTGDTTIGMPAIPPLGKKRRRTHGPGAESAVRRYPDWEHERSSATTANLAAIRGEDDTDVDIVDHRTPPEHRPAAVRPGAPRGYTAKHRRGPRSEPARLGLSTAGMTVAVGVLGAALTIMHTDPNRSADQNPQPPLAAVAPSTSGSPSPGTSISPQPAPTITGGATPSASPGQSRPATTPGPGQHPAPGPDQVRPGTSVEEPGGNAQTSGEQGSGEQTSGQQPTRRPTRPTRPTRTTQPDSGLTKPTPTCPADDAAPAGDVPASAVTAAAPQSATAADDGQTPDPDPDVTPSTSPNCP